MEVRDRLVVAVLAAGLLLGMAAWQAVHPWCGIVVGALALIGASIVYRFDASDRSRPEAPDGGEQELSTPRRVGGPL